MPITLNDLQFLQSQVGNDLLKQLENDDLSQHNLLSLVSSLRRKYTVEQVNAAVTMAQLRQKAVTKFGADAQELFFTDDALQQASDPQIRVYRSQNMNGKRVLDVCCGIGTDSIAFARAGAIVHAIDYNPIRIAIAQHNAQVLDLDIRFELSDVRRGIPKNYDLIFFDPARRDEQGKRLFAVEQYIPPLSTIHNWQAEQIMVKISPGVDLSQLEPYEADVEFISVEGDLKEALLHLPARSRLFATRIENGDVHHWYATSSTSDVPLAAPEGWLCEPDPAILRANLVQDVAAKFGGTMLDESIAYFCTKGEPQSLWIRAWKIREWMPFNLKKMRARLRAMDIGTVTVKKRGSPITPDDLIPKLKLKGTKSATVVLTRYDNQPISIICDDISPI